ncbi:MAG TPA: molybdopterin molybdenumtransferase MoeA, partial [Denitromonas sp.]|nr:molybdopterin molybdenumtransferase MoeA [Denitromonas sp.]
RKRPGRREFVRAIVRAGADGWEVSPTGAQGSGVLRSMSDANCFIVLPEARADVSAGDPVDIQLFDGLI